MTTTQHTKSPPSSDGKKVDRIKVKGRKVPKYLYNMVLDVIRETLPKIQELRGRALTINDIFGSEKWIGLGMGQRIAAGICLSDHVDHKRLGLIKLSKRRGNTLTYQLL